MAKCIVRGSLRPRENEPVVVSTYPHTIELAEEIVLECQRLGADPLIVLDTDATFYGQFRNYSIRNLKRPSAHCLGLLDYTRAYVWLKGPKDPAPMLTVPNRAWQASFEGEEGHHDKALRKRPKSVGVDIGLITRERARVYNFSYARWKEATESAITADSRQLMRMGSGVASMLSRPAKVQIVAPNGTDLRFRLAGVIRKPHVNDGVISREDLAAGSVETNLPGGAVWVAPVESSAEGTFTADMGIPQVGSVIGGLSWTFRHGHLVKFTAKNNLRAAKTNWGNATGARDVFGAFGLGINSLARTGFHMNHIVAGIASVGVGDNRTLGGANRSSYTFSSSIAHGSVEVDGDEVIRDGRWRV